VDILSNYKLENAFLTWNILRSILHNGWWLLVSLYLVTNVHLNATQLLLIAVAQGIVSIVFEVPAGIFADTVSRKWSIVISHILMGTAMFSTGLAHSFFAIVSTQMLWGISWAFASGSDVAWITDELNEPERISFVLIRAIRCQFYGAGIGMVIFAGLATIIGHRNAIIFAGVLMLFLGLLVIIKFTEQGFARTHDHKLKKVIENSTKLIAKDHIILLLALATFVINGAADAFSRTYPVILENLGLLSSTNEIIFFSVLNIGSYIIGALVLYCVEKRITYQNTAKMVMIFACSFGAISLGIISMASSAPLVIISILMASGITLPINRTVTTIWVNQRCHNNIRATIHSFLSQVEYLGEIICGLTIAVVARSLGSSGAMGCACVLFLIAIIVVSVIRTEKK